MDKALIAVIIGWLSIVGGLGFYGGMRWERLTWENLVPHEMDRVCNECAEIFKGKAAQ